jgi:hypothetical protein
MLPILMRQMRISTNQVSSVMLRPKKLEIRNKTVTVKERPHGKRTENEENWSRGDFCKDFQILLLWQLILQYAHAF